MTVQKNPPGNREQLPKFPLNLQFFFIQPGPAEVYLTKNLHCRIACFLESGKPKRLLVIKTIYRVKL